MSMKKLLVEVYRGNSLTIVAESLSPVPAGMMRVQGVFGVVDSVNRNNRFYPKSDYVKHVNLLQERIEKSNNVLGELEHPNSMTVDLNNASHKVEKVWFNEATNEVMGQILLLDTPKGLIAQSIIKAGSPLHISSRAVGTIDKKGAVTLENLATYDVVGTPGFEQANLYKLNESLSESGQLMTESFAYDIDANGKVVIPNQGINQSIVESLQRDMNSRIDEKIQDALKGYNKLDKTEILEAVKDYIKTEAAPDIQNYLRTEMQSAITEQNSAGYMTRNDVQKMMDERFITKYAPIIEKWTANEFAPVVEKWVTGEFAPIVEKWVATEYSSTIQNWITEQYSPLIQNWVTNEFAPVVEKWVTGEFAPIVEKWVATEYSGAVQGWVTEQYSELIQKWIIEQYSPVVEKWATKTIRSSKPVQSVTESRAFNSSKILDSLDELTAKADKAQKTVVTESAEMLHKKRINENFIGAPTWLSQIPDDLKESYLALSNESKALLARQASVRVLESAEAIEKFWRTRDFTNVVTHNVDVNKLQRQRQPITETQTQLNSYQRAIVENARNLRRN